MTTKSSQSTGQGDDIMISLQGVTKVYKKGKEKVSVLTGLDLDVKRGDFLALMGPSGSGKTTLLNLMGGLDRHTGGTLTIGGNCLDQLSTAQLTRWRARHVGFIFQFYNLMPAMTAAKNVELPLLLTKLGRKQRQQRVGLALQLVGLADRSKHYPNELSGGQEQRVAIARALVSDPSLLLCDEPTGDLDRSTANEILALLQELNQRKNKTIIMVTHDPLAASYAKRVLHMDKGKLVTDGATNEVDLPLITTRG